jgi:hypothetical protein
MCLKYICLRSLSTVYTAVGELIYLIYIFLQSTFGCDNSLGVLSANTGILHHPIERANLREIVESHAHFILTQSTMRVVAESSYI